MTDDLLNVLDTSNHLYLAGYRTGYDMGYLEGMRTALSIIEGAAQRAEGIARDETEGKPS